MSNQLRFFARRALCSSTRRPTSMLKIAPLRTTTKSSRGRMSLRLSTSRNASPSPCYDGELNFVIFMRPRGSEYGISTGFEDRTIDSFTPYRANVESCRTSTGLESKYDVAENAGKELLSHSSANTRVFNANSGFFPRATISIPLHVGISFAKNSFMPSYRRRSFLASPTVLCLSAYVPCHTRTRLPKYTCTFCPLISYKIMNLPDLRCSIRPA